MVVVIGGRNRKHQCRSRKVVEAEASWQATHVSSTK